MKRLALCRFSIAKIATLHRLLSIGLLISLLTPMSLAQEFRAILTGLVTDPSGAVVKGATVTAVNRDTGTTYTAQASDAGVYYISYVLPGTYQVTVKATGFRSIEQDNVVLVAAQHYGLNFKLEVGTTNETVTVTTAPPMIETASGSGGTLLDEHTIEEVPLDGRQVYMLIGTTPGSQFTQTLFGPGGYSGTRGWDNSNAYIMGGGAPTGNFTGALGGYNQFTLDGTNITQQTTYNNQNAGAWNVAPNIDAIQEVNVMTTTYDARYSRTGGGTVNVVTKNGTNNFHGDLYEFYEGALFDANRIDFIDQGLPRQGVVQNQFGGTFGGPIVKNKVFFFASYEGYRESIAGAVTTSVPPAYLRPGYNGDSGVDFGLIQQKDPQEFPNGIAIFNPSTTTCSTGGAVDNCNPNNLLRTAFPNDTIPAGDISKFGLAYLNLYPLPNVVSRQNLLSNNYFASTPDLYSYNQYMIRVDYDTSAKTKWYSFFEYQPGSENRSTNGFFGLAENGNVGHTRTSYTAAQDMTHVFSPTFMGDFKLSFARFADHSPDGNFAAAQTAAAFFGSGFTMPNIPTTTFKDVPECNDNDSTGLGYYCMGNAGNSSIGGFVNIAGNAITNDATTNVMLDADFTKSKGAHSIHFGGVYAEFQYGDPQTVGNANGQFNFASTATQFNGPNAALYTSTSGIPLPNGLGLADLLLGYPDGGHVDYNYTIMEGQPAWGLYTQDDWRVTHRLTLNLGLRYDVQRGLRERHNALNRGMCFTCVNPITNDPTYQANVANAANQAAWIAASITPSTLKTVLGGIQYAGVDGQSRDGYNTDWSNIAPRIGFAFAVDPRTVIRGGWGFIFGGGLEGGTTIGYTQPTNYVTSLDGNAVPNAPGFGVDYNGYSFATGNPYGSGVIHPQTTSLGLLTGLGEGQAIDFPDRKIPRSMIMSLGMQRELPDQIVLDARYSGNFASRLRVYYTVNNFATEAQVNQHIAEDAAGKFDNWSAQLPNPFFNVPAFANTGCGSSPTIAGIDLIAPLGQYCSGGIYQYNDPIGHTWYNALEVKLTKRTTHGLTFNLSYTYSKTMQATSFDGVGPSNGYGDNPYSAGEFPWQFPKPTHEASDYDRTHMLASTVVWDLPFGKGSNFLLTNPSAAVGAIVNHWSLSGIFAYSTGTPIMLPSTSGYNYVASRSLKPAGGPKYTQWLWENDGFPLGCSAGSPGCPAGGIAPAWAPDNIVSPWGIGYLRDFYTGVRDPSIPNLDLTLAKRIPVTESKEFQLRWEAFNVFNTRLYNGPDTNPGDLPTCSTTVTGAQECTGFGNINSTQQLNFPRRMQIALKFLF
ncbi:MAG TPA: TonB-dependent receptor [Terriglobales bacterium]|nr:TonB-dependent receptor [Terriglobales bacterium]